MTTRNLVVLSLSTALQVVLLLATLVVPTIKLSMLVAASLLNGLMVKSGMNKGYVVISFVATSILSFLLISNYIVPIAYVCFFGWYGIIHYIAKDKSVAVKQIVRWGALIVVSIIAFFVFNSVITSNEFFQTKYIYIAIPVAIVGYVAFQWVYEVVINQTTHMKIYKQLFF